MDDEVRFGKHRDEIRLYVYRMSGSLAYAESLTDQILFKASEELPHHDEDERARLYRIATGLCVESLVDKPPRGLPSWSGPPSDVLDHLSSSPEESDRWLQPYPDELLPENVCPNQGFGARESVSLTFVGTLQRLRPRERAALLLGGVIVLGEGQVTGALNSLPKGPDTAPDDIRSAFTKSYDRTAGMREPPSEKEAEPLIMRLVHFWEAGNVSGLESMLATDVIFQSPPSERWLQGRHAVSRFLKAILPKGQEWGQCRLLPRRANGQLAFGAYERETGRKTYRAHSINVIYFSGSSIHEMIVFRCPSLFPVFGLLPELIAQGE
jgi:RNA polymerase sigma-70 factor, ECF subfamily